MPERLDYVRDAARIYEQSFAVIRAEADLSGFSSDEAEIVVRMVHACGYVEITRRILFGVRRSPAVRQFFATRRWWRTA
jgi:precorrin-8X/cobalt-precorrin-8 methylmutase